MTESQRRAHLLGWLLIGPLAIGAIIGAVLLRPAGHAPTSPAAPAPPAAPGATP